MAADASLRHMACEAGRPCCTHAGKRKGRERVMRRCICGCRRKSGVSFLLLGCLWHDPITVLISWHMIGGDWRLRPRFGPRSGGSTGGKVSNATGCSGKVMGIRSSGTLRIGSIQYPHQGDTQQLIDMLQSCYVATMVTTITSLVRMGVPGIPLLRVMVGPNQLPSAEPSAAAIPNTSFALNHEA